MASIKSEIIEDKDPRINERFHLFPNERLKIVTGAGGAIGFVTGLLNGVNRASLVYLTENGHRLPKKVGGWYFYHKKKNYVMLVAGLRLACAQGFKYSIIASSFFGIEAIIDRYIRNEQKDFLSTTAASSLSFGLYGLYNRLSKVQIQNFVKKGLVLGLGLGIMQDMLIWRRGGDIWYLRKIKESMGERSLL